MSKGSRARKMKVPMKQFDSNWDSIFKKPAPKETDDAKAEDEAFKAVEEKSKNKD